MSVSVLYDHPGPKARMRSRIFGVVSLLALLGLVAWVLVTLKDQGQLDGEKWGPLLNPGHESFQQVWEIFLIPGLINTLKAAAISIVLSLIIGTAIGVLRMMLGRTARMPIVGLIELLRGLPVVIAILLAYTVLPAVGLDLNFMPGGGGLWYLVVGLTAYNSVIFAEILRAGVAALPRGQREAGLAIGLTPRQVMGQIQLPQAIRLMLPALISQLVVILKDTSLGGLISVYDELLNQGKQLTQPLKANLPVYMLVGAMFIAINFALSLLAQWVERRMAQGKRSAHTDIAPTELARVATGGAGALEAEISHSHAATDKP